MQGSILSFKLTDKLELFVFESKSAANRQQAIALWCSWQLNLILMNIGLPGTSGYEAIKIIKANQANAIASAKVIVLTASASGCNDFVRKPFRINDLLQVMTKHLGVCYTYAETSPVIEYEP